MILSYPKKIIPGHKLAFLLRELNIPHTNNPKEDGISHIIHWDYRNTNEIEWPIVELASNLKTRIINKECVNIRKDYLDKIFDCVFGYSSLVDPTEHKGTCVAKSTQNAIHSGRFVNCPINDRDVDYKVYPSKTSEPHVRIYQKLIDTRFDLDKIRDIRVPIIGGEIPCIFIKELGVLNTFHPYKENYNHVYMDDVDNWLTNDEVVKIKTLSVLMGLDFGELDVLRDNSTGLIYVVDINPIAMGSLFNKLSNKEEAIKLLSKTFKEKLL